MQIKCNPVLVHTECFISLSHAADFVFRVDKCQTTQAELHLPLQFLKNPSAGALTHCIQNVIKKYRPEIPGSNL